MSEDTVFIPKDSMTELEREREREREREWIRIKIFFY